MPKYRYTGDRDYYDKNGRLLDAGDVTDLSEYAYDLHSDVFEPVDDSGSDGDESADESASESASDSDDADAEASGVEIPDEWQVLRKMAATGRIPDVDGRSGKDEIVSALEDMDDAKLAALIESVKQADEGED